MLKPRRGGLVPWGLPGPTRGRDAAPFKLASKTKPPSQGPGTQAARMEGPSRGGARAHWHRLGLHVSPSCAPLRTALGVETDPW